MSIFEAAMQYKQNGIPLLILAGKEYGTGSSRDWAAKGASLLGVKAVIAESFERIHISNLVGMGVLLLQFQKGENIERLDLKGNEVYDILGIINMIPGSKLEVHVKNKSQILKKFSVNVRLDTPIELEYFQNGGILHTVLRNMLKN